MLWNIRVILVPRSWRICNEGGSQPSKQPVTNGSALLIPSKSDGLALRSMVPTAARCSQRGTVDGSRTAHRHRVPAPQLAMSEMRPIHIPERTLTDKPSGRDGARTEEGALVKEDRHLVPQAPHQLHAFGR